MIYGHVEKQPAETFLVRIDFGPSLAVGETISSQTITAKNEVTGADTSSAVLTGAPVVSGHIISHRIRSGQDGERHIIQFRINTSQANVYEGEIVVSVLEY